MRRWDVRHWALAALLAPAFVACELDRGGTYTDAATSGGATTGGGSSVTQGNGTSSGPPAGAGGGAGGRDPSGGGAGGGQPLECWGPDTICCANAIPCPTATMECCLADQDSGELATCVEKDTCPTLTVSCDDSEDCPGSICCIDWNGYNFQSVKCEDTCDPPYWLGDAGEYPMCNVVGGTCPRGLDCIEDDYVGEVGWGYCF